MAEAATTERLVYAEYLRQERQSMLKHQWVSGEMFAMTGGTPEHARLQATVASTLAAALAGKPCAVYGADLRIRSRHTDIATYADVTVVCGQLETDPEDPDAAINPVVVVEVLSPSTEAYDRGDKAAHYRRIPALREYVLVAQDSRRIEVFRREDGGRWEFEEASAGQSIRLTSIDAELVVDEIYANPLEASAGSYQPSGSAST